MAVYPDAFPHDQIMNRFEEGVVILDNFRDRLSSLFTLFHKPLKDAGVWYLCQCRSLFDGLTIAQDFERRPEESGHAQPIEAFRLGDLVNCDEKGMTYESPTARTSRELKFFTPIFVWNFNKTKKQLAGLEEEIYALRAELFRERSDLHLATGKPEEELSAPEPPVIEDRFRHGTALEIRKSDAWGEHKSQ